MNIPNILETKRLIIRPFNKDDLNPFISFMINEEATKYLSFTEAEKTPEGAKTLIHSIINSYNTQYSVCALAITQKESGKYLGSCGLTPLKNNNDAECFYALLPEYWGNGYAIECMRKLFDHAFTELKLSKIIAHVKPKNTRSWKTAERAGMKYMGQIRLENLPSEVMLFSIERSDFEVQMEI
jgi:RimJ/RimL family protein N-acetyltransferase